jgi:hypothetical protein
MSFLNQLKTQAQALQSQRKVEDRRNAEAIEQTEQACGFILSYLDDLARQLSVIEPPGPALTIDGRTPWPAVKLVEFRVDARRKGLGDREVFDYIAIGWRIVPRAGEQAGGVVTVNFPTDMQRVEDRLALGPVKHERIEVRHPERSVLQEVRYAYEAQTRGGVTVTPDHENGQIRFRLLNTDGLEVAYVSVPPSRVGHDLMDELAKRIVGHPNVFI